MREGETITFGYALAPYRGPWVTRWRAFWWPIRRALGFQAPEDYTGTVIMLNGQARMITDYNPRTKTATITPWDEASV